jgi:hypothetical protein
VESTLVVVLLQKGHLRLFAVARAVGKLHVLGHALVLGHGAAALNLLALRVGLGLRLLVPQQTRELAHPPRVEFRLGVQPVRVIHVWDQVRIELFYKLLARYLDGV